MVSRRLPHPSNSIKHNSYQQIINNYRERRRGWSVKWSSVISIVLKDRTLPAETGSVADSNRSSTQLPSWLKPWLKNELQPYWRPMEKLEANSAHQTSLRLLLRAVRVMPSSENNNLFRFLRPVVSKDSPEIQAITQISNSWRVQLVDLGAIWLQQKIIEQAQNRTLMARRTVMDQEPSDMQLWTTKAEGKQPKRMSLTSIGIKTPVCPG